MVRTRLGHVYLCQPLPLQPQPEPTDHPLHDIVALDPGVCTFMHAYDPQCLSAEWGGQDIQRVFRLCHAVDKLQSAWSQQGVTHKRRCRLQRAARRIRLKIRNIVDDLHKKLAKWLVDSYRQVLLPTFDTSKMVVRGARKIRSKTARQMLTWSHYRFKMRLISKAREHPWCQVKIVNEAYTSKTCGDCGAMNHDVAMMANHRIYNCRTCHFEADRDFNGARNILLRHLTESVGPPPPVV